MNPKLDRIQELISEIKILREVNSTLHQQINSLNSQIYSKDNEIKNQNIKIEKLQSNIGFLEAEKTGIQKRANFKIKSLEIEARRNGVFGQKVMATSKTKKEHLMIEEMDSLRKINKILLHFIDVLSREFEFDGDLVKTLVDIAEGVDDRILQLFLEGLRQRTDVIMEDIRVGEEIGASK